MNLPSMNATNAPVREYLAEGEYALGTTSASYFYGIDQIGSIRRVFASSGAAPAYSYDPYGNPLGTAAPLTDARYAGMFTHGASGFDLTLYRIYDPMTGRWLSRDPLGEQAGQNNYAYADNDPIGETDPMGLMGHGPGPTPRRPKPPIRDCPDKPKAPQPFPIDWPSSTWRQIFCSIRVPFAGVGAIGTDVACGTDYTGNNPDDPRNASRESEANEKYTDEVKDQNDDADHETEKAATEERAKSSDPEEPYK